MDHLTWTHWTHSGPLLASRLATNPVVAHGRLVGDKLKERVVHDLIGGLHDLRKMVGGGDTGEHGLREGVAEGAIQENMD